MAEINETRLILLSIDCFDKSVVGSPTRCAGIETVNEFDVCCCCITDSPRSYSRQCTVWRHCIHQMNANCWLLSFDPLTSVVPWITTYLVHGCKLNMLPIILLRPVFIWLLIFTALHGMQTRSSDENSVSPSVCLSNAWIVTKRKKNQCRFSYRAKHHLT